jgi:carbohydrate diacid regulator
LRSLEAFFANGQSIAAAARALHVHRHTLEYRLERITALLGDVREPGRGPFLELALALRR